MSVRSTVRGVAILYHRHIVRDIHKHILRYLRILPQEKFRLRSKRPLSEPYTDYHIHWAVDASVFEKLLYINFS